MSFVGATELFIVVFPLLLAVVSAASVVVVVVVVKVLEVVTFA